MTAIVWLFLAGGCEPLAPARIEDVAFDEGVALDTHGPVAFRVAAPLDDATTIWVRLADGREVYSGPASIPARRDLDLRVPQGTTELWVERAGVTAAVAVVDGRAVFGGDR